MSGDDLYLPTAPTKLVRGIQVDSGIPLQSAAKVPIMITFNVVDRHGDHNDVKPQSCIFKVLLFSIIYYCGLHLIFTHTHTHTNASILLNVCINLVCTLLHHF